MPWFVPDLGDLDRSVMFDQVPKNDTVVGITSGYHR